MKANLCNTCREPMPQERIARCKSCCAKHGAEDFTEEVHYGAFSGGDPRNFWPDPEMSTESEIRAWKAACELAAWDPGACNLPPSGGAVLVGGKAVAFTDKASLGY